MSSLEDTVREAFFNLNQPGVPHIPHIPLNSSDSLFFYGESLAKRRKRYEQATDVHLEGANTEEWHGNELRDRLVRARLPALAKAVDDGAVLRVTTDRVCGVWRRGKSWSKDASDEVLSDKFGAFVGKSLFFDDVTNIDCSIVSRASSSLIDRCKSCTQENDEIAVVVPLVGHNDAAGCELANATRRAIRQCTGLEVDVSYCSPSLPFCPDKRDEANRMRALLLATKSFQPGTTYTPSAPVLVLVARANVLENVKPIVDDALRLPQRSPTPITERSQIATSIAELNNCVLTVTLSVYLTGDPIRDSNIVDGDDWNTFRQFFSDDQTRVETIDFGLTNVPEDILTAAFERESVMFVLGSRIDETLHKHPKYERYVGASTLFRAHWTLTMDVLFEDDSAVDDEW